MTTIKHPTKRNKTKPTKLAANQKKLLKQSGGYVSLSAKPTPLKNIKVRALVWTAPLALIALAIISVPLFRQVSFNIPPNTLRNPSFESTGSSWASPWILQVFSGYAAGSAAQDGTTAADGRYSAKITVTRANPNPLYVQLRQIDQVQHVNNLETLQFWAKASTNRTMTVIAQQATAPYTLYTQSVVNLGTGWQAYSVAYRAPVSFNNVQLAFRVANATGSVWIDKTKFTDSNSSHSIYTGVSVPSNPSNLSQVTAFEAHAGKPVSIVMWYQQWGAQDGSQNFQSSWLNNVRSHGSIPEVTWEPWVGGGGVSQPAYSLGAIISGKYDAYIKQWALASKAWGHPYFLRFAHEMNGNWYPWDERVNGNTTGQYVQAWIHVHNIFIANGARNVTWVWAPNVEYNGSTSLRGLFPGSSYVDWTGMDGYNWGTLGGKSWQAFDQVFGQTYNDVQAISSKPIMVAETASTEVGGSKTNWINDALAYKLPIFFPNVKAITWFDYNKETDWRIESSSAAQNAFMSAMQEYLYRGNQYGGLTQSPVPAP